MRLPPCAPDAAGEQPSSPRCGSRSSLVSPCDSHGERYHLVKGAVAIRGRPPAAAVSIRPTPRASGRACRACTAYGSRYKAQGGRLPNEVWFSAVSVWEIAIKSRLGRLPLPEPPSVFVPRMIERHALGVMPIHLKHTLADFDLPAHHHDPFDRFLVAQALSEGMTLVTDDRAVSQYPVETLW